MKAKIVVKMITNPEINRKNGLAFNLNAFIFSLDIPIRNIANTAIIGINTPIENNPKASVIFPVLNVPV